MKFLKNPYIIAGGIVFVFLVILGLFLKFSLGETLLASAVLTIIGVGVSWWEREVW